MIGRLLCRMGYHRLRPRPPGALGWIFRRCERCPYEVYTDR